MRKEKLSSKENFLENKKKLSKSKIEQNNFKKMSYKKFKDLFIKGQYQNKKNKKKFKKPLSFVLKRKNFLESPEKPLITNNFKKLRDFQRGKRSYIMNKNSSSSSINKEKLNLNFKFIDNKIYLQEKRKRAQSAYKLVEYIKNRSIVKQKLNDKFKNLMIISNFI